MIQSMVWSLVIGFIIATCAALLVLMFAKPGFVMKDKSKTDKTKVFNTETGLLVSGGFGLLFGLILMYFTYHSHLKSQSQYSVYTQ